MLRLICNHTAIKLPCQTLLPPVDACKSGWGQTSLSFLPAQHCSHALSAKKGTDRGDFFSENQFTQWAWDPYNMVPKWTNSLRFSAELPSICLHGQLSSSLRKKQNSWLIWTLMPTLKFPVVLTACETRKKNAAHSGDSNWSIWHGGSETCARWRKGWPCQAWISPATNSMEECSKTWAR